MRSIRFALSLSGLGLAIVITGCGGGNSPQSGPMNVAVSVTPLTATVQVGATAPVTASVSGDPTNAGVTWSVSCSGGPCGTVSPTTTASGVAATYTAPTTFPAGDLMVVLIATSVADSTVSNSATFTVPGITISITQSATTVPIGTKAQLTAVVTNAATSPDVTWTVSCGQTACGTVSPTKTASGAATTYTAPATFPAGDLTVTITATSVANSLASSSTTVTVPGTNVSITQSTGTVLAGATAQVTATVTNDTTNAGVTWTVSCTPMPCGAILPAATASGIATTYTAPSTPPASDLTVTITATSVFNTQASNFVTVSVPAVTVSVTPVSALLPGNVALQFTANVGNDPTNQGVTWTLTQSGTACSPGCGTLSSANSLSGTPATYTAPAAVPATPAVTLTATSVEDATKSAKATITISAGTVELVPASVDFGGVFVGANSSTRTATLTNTGNSALSITSVTFTGADPGDFSETDNCGKSVGAGSFCILNLSFKPKASGSRSADASITDSSTGSPQQVSLTGTGITRRGGFNQPAVQSALGQAGAAAVPFPEGPDKVGTRVVDLIDSVRQDPYLAKGSKRELLVRFWYPASLKEPCKPAEYTSARVWNHFSQLVGVQVAAVTTNSCWNAAITEGTHPVVVFTPGYTATFTDYTFILEDLASRGYVVASVDHTFEATAVEFPDGRLVESVFGSHLGGKLRGDDQALSFATSVRLQDLKFVVNELEQLSVQADSPFAGRLDTSRIALAGHSMGGAIAFLGVEQDTRFKTGIVIDGHVPDALIHATETPVLILDMGSEKWSEDQCRLWGNLNGPRIAVNLQGAEHVTPSDAVWLAKYAIKTGPMGPDRTIAAVRNYIAAFLDTHLRDRPRDPLLSGPSSDYPDAAVITQMESLCGATTKGK